MKKKKEKHNLQTYILGLVTIVTSIIFTGCCLPSTQGGSSYSTNLASTSDPSLFFYSEENSKDGKELEKKYPNEDFVLEEDFSYTTFSQGNVTIDSKKNSKKEDVIIEISSIDSKSGEYDVDLYLTKKQEKEITLLADKLTGSVALKQNKFDKIIESYKITSDKNKVKFEENEKNPINNLKMPNPSMCNIYNFKSLISTKDFVPNYIDQIEESEFIKHKNYKANFGNIAFEPKWIKIENPEDGNFNNGNTYYRYNYKLPIRGTKLEISHNLDFENAIYNCVNYIPGEVKCLKKTISFEIPSWLEIEVIEKNFGDLKFKKSVSKPKKIPYIDTVVKNSLNTKSKGKNTNKQVKNSNTESFKYITYEFENVGSYEDYAKNEQTNGPSYYLPQIVILYKKAEINKKVYPLTGSVSGLCSWYKSLINNLKNDTVAASKKANELTKDLKTEEEKIKTIYYWIQDNIRYVAKEDGLAGFIPENSNKVFKDKFGDCKGMANLMYVMLKSVNLDARRVWIGTNHLNYTYDSTPGLMTDNHMICAVKTNNKLLFLDGTEKYVPYNEVAYRIQDRQCIMEDGDSFLLVKVPANNYLKNKDLTISNFNIENNNLKGNVVLSLDGESRLNIIRGASYSNKNSIENNLYDYISGNNNIIPSNIKHSDFENREGTFTLNYDVLIKNQIIETSDSRFVNLNYNYVQLEKMDSLSKNNLDLNDKINSEFKVTLDFGKPFKIIQKLNAINIDNEYYSIICNYEVKNNSLMLNRIINIKKGYIPINMKKSWNADIKTYTSFVSSFIKITL